MVTVPVPDVLPAGTSTSVALVVCPKPPLVPLIVIGNVPVGDEATVVTVRVEDPEPHTEPGLKPAEAPEGNPLALSVVHPANPFTAPTVAVYVAL